MGFGNNFSWQPFTPHVWMLGGSTAEEPTCGEYKAAAGE